MTGIVLAGGESRRMGVNKAFLTIAGVPLVQRVIRTLQTVVGHIIVVTNSPEDYAAFDVETAPDVIEKRGSLIGIYSGLLRSREARNLVVACDMPFLNPDLIQYLYGIEGDYDVILPKIGEYVEPLHAIYSRDLLPVIESHITRDQCKIRAIFAGRRVRFVTEMEIDRFDPTRRSFINVNTPDEYEEVTCSDLECRN